MKPVQSVPLAQLKQLLDFELYHDAYDLSCLLLSVFERSDRNTSVSLIHQYEAIVCHALTCKHLQYFKKAEHYFMKGLQMRRSHKDEMQSTTAVTSETDLRWHLHECLLVLNRIHEAVGVLESIPARSRTPKINRALGELYERLGNSAQAKACYAELVQAVPSALNTMTKLQKIGMLEDELHDLRGGKVNAAPDIDGNLSPWFGEFIAAQAALHAGNFKAAVQKLQDLTRNGPVSNNVHVLLTLAEAYYRAGANGSAILVYQKVNTQDPYCLTGMDILSSLLYEDKRIKDLESLTARLTSTHSIGGSNSENAGTESTTCIDMLPGPEPWIAFGYLAAVNTRLSRSLFFAHKACHAGPKPTAQALVLKGRVLILNRRNEEAARHFHEAIATDPCLYEAHKGLVDTFLSRARTQDAKAAARHCVEQLKQSPRSLALYAKILIRNPAQLEQAQVLLEKVVAGAPHLLSAVYDLLDIYDRRGLCDKAVTLLRKQTDMHVQSRLHKMFGDFLQKVNRHQEALDKYREAQALDDENALNLQPTIDELEDELIANALQDSAPETSNMDTETENETPGTPGTPGSDAEEGFDLRAPPAAPRAPTRRRAATRRLNSEDSPMGFVLGLSGTDAARSNESNLPT